MLVSTLARLRLVVKFVDDRCTVHDLSSNDMIIAFGTLFHGLYRLNKSERCMEDSINAIFDSKEVLDAKLWYAHFVHLNFSSLLHFQRSNMVALLPLLEAPSKHVCEGFILGKMEHSSFPRDGYVWATCKITTYT